MTLPVIAHRYGRPWLSVLAALAVLLATCLAAPGGALALPKAHPMHKITGGMYKNPIGRLSFLWRRSVSPSLQNAWGRNVGIGFADVTDKTNIKTNLRNVWLADVEQMKQDDPALYRALRLDQRPGVKTIAIIIRANTPKRNHAEQNILRALAEMGLGTDSLFQLYSDRSPCRYRCRALVPGHVDVDYLVKNEGKAKEPDSDFSKESTELLRRELAEAFADFEKDPAKPDLDPEAEWHRAEVARRQGKAQTAEARNEALFRSMILPRLTAEINTSPRYAELRRVYLARVAAEWYRQRSARDDTAYGGLIDKGDVRRWASHDSWRPTDTFEKYVHSVRHGEFRVVHRSTHGNVVTTHTYVFGGVDFARVPFRAMSAAAFGRAAPNLARTVRQATDHPVVDPRLGKVLMGAPAPTVQRTPSITGLLVVSVPLLLSVLIALGFALWIVVRRRRRTRRLPA